MQHPSITKALETIPVELRDGVARWFERLVSVHGKVDLPEDVARQITRLVACSEFASSVLLKEWHWFVDCRELLHEVPDRAELDSLVDAVRRDIEDIDVAKERIRRFRYRWMLRILWREIMGCRDARRNSHGALRSRRQASRRGSGFRGEVPARAFRRRARRGR